MKLYEKIKTGIYTIAEMSANHGGSLENALKIVKAAKTAGADCLKIQTYTANTMTINCDNDYFKIKGGLWDGYKLFDLYNEAYTPWEWHKAIKNKCERLGMDFLSTPFDKSAVDFLENLNVEFYKIASFELVDIPLIEYTASKGKPMIISCGMGSVKEIEEAVNACKLQGNNNIILLKCCSEYPANYNDMNLSVLTDMREKYGVPVGFSDHSMGSLAAVVAVSLGACVVEKHFCLKKSIKTTDSEFSMNPQKFKKMVQELNNAYKIKGISTYSLTEKEKASIILRRSVFAVKDIKKGELFSDENIRVIRPGYGMKPKYYKALLGHSASQEYTAGNPIMEEIQNE